MAEAEEDKGHSVASYRNVAFTGAWMGRARGIWGVAALGLLFGAGVGLCVPLFTSLFMLSTEVLTTTAFIHSIAIFSAVGMASGLTAGTIVGTSAGAAASTIKELEKRTLKHEEAMEKALGISIDSEETKLSKNDNQTYVNFKVMSVFMLLGAAAGLIMAGAFFASGVGLAAAAVPSVEAVIGTSLITSNAAVTAYFTAVMTCFGGLFGFNFPKMATDLQEFAGGLLGGELLGTNWNKEPELSKQVSRELPPAAAVEHSHSHPDKGVVLVDHEKIHGSDKRNVSHVERLGKSGQVVSYRDFVSKPLEESVANGLVY